jgi:hypothetical protein
MLSSRVASPPSLLPSLLILANYRGLSDIPETSYHGRSEKEDFALAPQHASLAPRIETGCLRRMPELRRTQAPASPLQSVRLL